MSFFFSKISVFPYKIEFLFFSTASILYLSSLVNFLDMLMFSPIFSFTSSRVKSSGSPGDYCEKITLNDGGKVCQKFFVSSKKYEEHAPCPGPSLYFPQTKCRYSCELTYSE